MVGKKRPDPRAMGAASDSIFAAPGGPVVGCWTRARPAGAGILMWSRGATGAPLSGRSGPAPATGEALLVTRSNQCPEIEVPVQRCATACFELGSSAPSGNHGGGDHATIPTFYQPSVPPCCRTHNVLSTAARWGNG